MDDTPAHFLEELKLGVLKSVVGKLAMALILGLATLNFLNSVVAYLIMPIVTHLFGIASRPSLFYEPPVPFPWMALVTATLQFLLAIVVVFYVNRWIRVPRTVGVEEGPSPLALNCDAEPSDEAKGELFETANDKASAAAEARLPHE